MLILKFLKTYNFNQNQDIITYLNYLLSFLTLSIPELVDQVS